ncbi:MAG: DUF255 domain-containing protein [Thiomicrospira sp.]|nr:DUF255 domain-containing protein [Thiomicrospira sp.]
MKPRRLATNPNALRLLTGLLLLSISFSSAANALTNHPSAYLAQHADDPIHWQLWQDETFAQAQRQNKLIFVSSGYFACHWCHVMQQENYRDPDIARLINQHFIAIKIDRELQPDIDTGLLNFARRHTGQAGWPLHAILTPEGQPFAAFIYQPSAQLNRTLNQLQHWWQTQPDTLRRLAQTDSALPPSLIHYTPEQFARALLQQLPQYLDMLQGGLEGTQKFPHSPLLNALISYAALPSELQDWLILTLEQMQNEHLYDHVYDGFFRYTVDPSWQTPHFEKMLYDNAQLAEVFFRAGVRFARTDFIHTAERTLSYIQHALYNPITGLADASQSALDSKGQDGGVYLWQAEQLRAQLSAADYALIEQNWQLKQAPPLPAGWLPKALNTPAWPAIQQQLRQRRPLNDNKQLLSWNARLLSAYAAAYRATAKDSFRLRGHALSQRLLDLIQLPTPPRAITDKGQQIGQALLEDYAYLARALADWQTLDNASINLRPYRQTLIQRAQAYQTETGWKTRPQSPAQTTLADQATPSPSALLACDLPHPISLPASTPLWHYTSYLLPCEP